MYTIGDFLIRLKNAYMARKKTAVFPYSKTVVAIGKILREEGYLKSIEEKEDSGKKVLTAELLYKGKYPAISEIKLLSKPSVHRYSGKSALRKRMRDMGVEILSTSQGIMTNKKAYAQGIGGELIARIS